MLQQQTNALAPASCFGRWSPRYLCHGRVHVGGAPASRTNTSNSTGSTPPATHIEAHNYKEHDTTHKFQRDSVGSQLSGRGMSEQLIPRG
jgi:hypothetical protein